MLRRLAPNSLGLFRLGGVSLMGRGLQAYSTETRFHEIQKCLGITNNTPENWKSITKKQVEDCGGKELLSEYDGSLFHLLDSLFPNEYWYGCIRVSNNYWDSLSNQRKFMKKFEEKNNIQNEKDWYNVKYRTIQKQGGSKLLKKYNNLPDALCNIFPEKDWNFEENEVFPKGYWQNLDNQRKYIEKLGDELGIKSLSDWKTITVNDFKRKKYGAYLLSLNGGGLFQLLQKIYPNYPWDVDMDRERKPRNYWKDPNNHLIFMENLRKKLGLKEITDWHHVDWTTIKKNGGSALLNLFDSYYDLLCSVYKDYEWDIFRLQNFPKGFWKDTNNHKKFLEYIYKKLNFKSLDDWNNISVRDFSKEGGSSMLLYYPSFIDMLKTHYPDHDWCIHKRKQRPNGYWKEKKNHRQYLDIIAKKFDIKEPSDWKNITLSDLYENGASSLFRYYPSFYDALVKNYPEMKWDVFEVRKITPRSYFKIEANQRKFLDEIIQKENLSSPEDLVPIPLNTIKKYGGYGLLLQYNNDWIKVLRSNYPEYNFESSKLRITPSEYWDSIENQREFLDSLWNELNIKEYDDWYNVLFSQVVDLGGGALLKKYDSLFSMLETLYPEHDWDINKRSNVSRNYWNSPENVKLVMEEVKQLYKIKKKKDWYRVSLKQISKVKGGNVIIRRYRNIYNIMNVAYPEEEWSEKGFSKRDKRSNQRWLFLSIQELFKGEEIVEDFFHEELTRISKNSVQLDIFIPKYNLGFEYHGEHHYKDIPAFGHLDMQQTRDNEKIALCEKYNVKLIVIPYWWDGELDSLSNTIEKVYPGILNSKKVK